MKLFDSIKKEWALKAIQKTTDEEKLKKYAQKATERDVRMAAVKKLTNQSVLTDIAKNDGSKFVRMEAVERLTDQSVLSDIAKNDKDEWIRNAAVKKLTNQSVLTDIAKNDGSVNVRLQANTKLSALIMADIAEIRHNKADTKLSEVGDYLDSDDFRNEIERAKQARDRAARDQWASQDSPGDGRKHACCMCKIETYGEETVLRMQQHALMQNNVFQAQRVEQQSAYRCRNCGKEYCKDCLEKKAPGNAYGGKSCPSCYGLFEIVHG
jgi:hypothetical protein